MLVMSAERAKALGLEARAKIRSMAVAGPTRQSWLRPGSCHAESPQARWFVDRRHQRVRVERSFAAQSLPVLKDLKLR